MRGIALLVAAAVLSVALVGCGGSSGNGGHSTSTAGGTSSTPGGTSAASSALASSTSQSSGSGAAQVQTGTAAGQAMVQAWTHPLPKYPTTTFFVMDFNQWMAGKVHGQPGAPPQPLSPQATAAAAVVALKYLQGAHLEGYIIAYRDGQLMFRCRAKGNPASELCQGPHWQAWQA
jgi:hypothetical protein